MGRKRNGKYIGQNILVPHKYFVGKDIYYISLWVEWGSERMGVTWHESF